MKIKFAASDFRWFEKQYQRKREYNQYRLNVKRKLGKLGKTICSELKNQGVTLKTKTSLHHPYIHNNFSVNSLWLYFGPDPKTLKTLKTIFGEDLGKDLDTTYTHTIFVVGIYESGLFISLKINQNAWWDSQNLKNKLLSKDKQKEFVSLLNSLDAFYMRLHDWPNRHHCNRFQVEDLVNFHKYFTPGEHWLHIDQEVPVESAVEKGEDVLGFFLKELTKLIPLYQFITWSDKNDYISQSLS